ncbi:MAG: Ppx/GppA phosphatase family protein [Pacificimonas sp.]|jgi:exopolyphosphatase/guanosine-5'-triphosphate,3'-diphosphate pyrophosphatase|nr:Ppx/GppA phosphatase family protein [Pacificimonas sp.]
MATHASPQTARRGRAKHIPKARRVYGAIDLGTNNCRLLVARPTRGGFYVIDAFSRIVRLGENLLETGRLSDASMTKAVDALQVCAEKLRRRDVWVTRNVATEACRRADNGAAFIERVYKETGIALDVITPAEEAQLAVLGCQALFRDGYSHALVFDIGGGSTEISLVECQERRATRQLGWWSVPWGVVSLTETERALPPDVDGRREVFERMRGRVMDDLGRAKHILSPPEGLETLQLLGTSGTITTLTSLHLGLPSYDRSKVDGAWVKTAAMRKISQTLSAMSEEERADQPCIGRERAAMIVAGCAILDAILASFPVERLCVADRGIREGILRTLMQRDGHW